MNILFYILYKALDKYLGIIKNLTFDFKIKHKYKKLNKLSFQITSILKQNPYKNVIVRS